MTISIPTLETERLILRGWQQSDAPAIIALGQDEELMRYVGGKMDTVHAWRRMAAYAGQWLLKGYGPFALQSKASGQFIGYSGVWDPDGWPEREINWGLVRGAHGQGFVTEAAARVRAFAYDALGFETIASCIDQDNHASQNVARRLGCVLDRVVDFRGRPMGVWRHITPQACRKSRGAR